jgi:hypothetical protein
MMIMNRNEFAGTVMLGWFIGLTSFALVYMISVALDAKPQESQKPQSNFEVVDTYKNCEVVRWAQSNHLAEYKYFIHCPS